LGAASISTSAWRGSARVKRPPRYDLPKAAPGFLRPVQAYVNTTDHEELEALSSPTDLQGWLEGRGLLANGPPPSGSDLRRALVVREALRVLLQANNLRYGPHVARATLDEAVANLDVAARRALLSLEFGKGGARLMARAPGTNGALGRLLILVFAAMTDGSWSRLKACRNCRWIFYDYSRNRSATWCSMALCGNRQKTRLYRSRRRSRH
jgi:predicted RNA-binding Zn ribbon-like protein